ncbi:flagellar hook assembly protein FlgD [Pseudomonas oryzihabitans]|uniref:flagellar hook assembly protein FlgD n=1 Tax=Pseudomonas oryzihabitans TaxID=47885 RepID=UPI00119D1C00|nr:flagellar hook assembly protein FlgD [Pseudomonas psychrotolerans]
MTTTSSTTSSSSLLSSVLSNSKVSSSSATSSGATTSGSTTSSLGKNDFLKLLVTQLNNQNPLNPQDNTEFVAQLAQFSSVESLQNLNTSVDSIVSNYNSSQALQASSLVGRSVIAAGSTAVVDTTSGMTGSVVLPSSGSDLSVGVYNSAGSLVDTIPLEASSAGTHSFSWDGKDSSGQTLASGTYTFKATAAIGGTSTALTTYLPNTVSSVTLGTSGSDMTLNLADGTNVALANVKTIGQ